MGTMDRVSIDDFAKLEIRVGTVVECSLKENSNNLLRLSVDFGELGRRTILSGLRRWFEPATIEGHQFAFITNLEPRTMIGEESHGMMLTIDGDTPTLLVPQAHVPDGMRLV